MTEEISTDYTYSTADANHTNAYLWTPVARELSSFSPSSAKMGVFDLGCGNGALARHLEELGYEVTGVDPSQSGIEIAKREHPSIRLEIGNAYENLAARYGQFRAVVSLEVVEHVYFPRKYARCIHDLLEPGGIAIISTPYHSYLKN
ncbi:MAG: methyltransferase domain-containing protein, partial [Verrucomicrobiales bacterium]